MPPPPPPEECFRSARVSRNIVNMMSWKIPYEFSPNLMPSTHRRRRRDSRRAESRRRRQCEQNSQLGLAHDDCRRIPSTTDQTDSIGLTTWILIDIDNCLNNDVIMSSLVTNLNSSTAQEIVMVHDCWRVRSHRRRDSARQSASAVCVGLFTASMRCSLQDRNELFRF